MNGKVKKYQQKPVEAIQWDGKNEKEVIHFLSENKAEYSMLPFIKEYTVMTHSGERKVKISDFIVKGASGDFYVFTEEDFLANFEAI